MMKTNRPRNSISTGQKDSVAPSILGDFQQARSHWSKVSIRMRAGGMAKIQPHS